MIKLGVVVPCYKKELFMKFYNKWDWKTSTDLELKLYIVEDNQEKTIPVTKELINNTDRLKHYCWKDIDEDLEENSWIISRRSSAIRSYGYLKAYEDGCDYVLTLDDDCYPYKECKSIELLFEQHLDACTLKDEYSNTFNVGGFLFPHSGLWMRGSPIRYRKSRKAVVSVGGWSNNPDLDAWTQLEYQSPKLEPKEKFTNVPKYSGITMCGMNVMFSRETIPIAYFLLQGERWGVDRVDDIWAGLFMKKVLDKFDLPMAINGYASVFHDRASDAMTSLKKEGLTLQETELLWDRLMTLQLEGDSLIEAYQDMIVQCEPEWFGTKYYGEKLIEACLLWTELFQK